MASKYRQYDSACLIGAAKLVKDEKFSVYEASTECKMSWSTLKDFLKRAEDTDTDVGRCVDLPKLGKPFALSIEMEQRLYM